MVRKFLLRFVTVVIVLAALGFIGFAYLADLSPDRHETTLPVSIVPQ